jgi:hypothetical protein
MIPRTLMVGAALVPSLLGMSPQERGAGSRPARELWVFLSLAETDLRADFKAIHGLRQDGAAFTVRPCLLVEEFTALKKSKEVHVENVKALRELVGEGMRLPILDEEGLSMARALGVERVPAFCLVDPVSRRAHVTYGRGARLSEVLRCE